MGSGLDRCVDVADGNLVFVLVVEDGLEGANDLCAALGLALGSVGQVFMWYVRKWT